MIKIKMLEADKSTTGSWCPVNNSEDDLCLCFKMVPCGGTVTIEGTYDDDNDVVVTIVEAETEACVIYAKNKPQFAKVRATVTNPTTGVASVWMVE